MAKRSVLGLGDDEAVGLVKVGTKELGRGLVEAAQEANRQAVQSAAVGHVQTLMMMLRKQRDYQANSAANIALIEEKLAAIDAGAFTLSPYGGLRFNDPDLEKAVVGLIECPNCGYDIAKRNQRG